MNTRVRLCVLLTVLLALLIIAFMLYDRNPLEETATVISKVVTTNPATSWVYVTDKLQLIVSPTTAGAVCSIEWLQGTPKTVAFYTTTETDERRTLAGNTSVETCTITEDISGFDYIGLTIDGETIGGLEPPDGYAGVTPMHFAITLPDNPTTLYPTSGRWQYSMTANETNLTCVTGTGGITADGSVDFVTANYGLTASLSAGSTAITFTRAGYNNPHYYTPHYSTAAGYVEYNLDVLDQEYMQGTLHMQGDSCAGDFPIAMTLETPSVPPIYVPHQGSWNMYYGPLLCGSTPLVNLPINTAMLSVTGGGPVPMTLSFSGTPGSLLLNQSPGTNLYSGYPNMVLGTANNVITGQPFQVIGNWNVTALSESQLMGTLAIAGTDGCSGATTVLFENY